MILRLWFYDMDVVKKRQNLRFLRVGRSSVIPEA